MIQISQEFKEEMKTDGYEVLFERYDAIQEIWPRYYAEQKIKGGYWKSTSKIGTSTFRRTPDGEGFQASPIAEGFTVFGRVHTFTDAVCISYDSVDDNQKVADIVKEAAGEWGEMAPATREEFYARPFNQGGKTAGDWIFNGTPQSKAETDPSGDGAYDGLAASIMPWFNLEGNERKSKGGGSYYNGKALALTPDNLKTILTHMIGTNNRRENDTYMVLNPDCIVYATPLDFLVKEILNSTLASHVSTNTTNVLNNILDPIKQPYLETASAFYVGHKKKGIVALNRQAPVINFVDAELQRCYWATVSMRIGFMMKNWRFWMSSNAPTS